MNESRKGRKVRIHKVQNMNKEEKGGGILREKGVTGAWEGGRGGGR